MKATVFNKENKMTYIVKYLRNTWMMLMKIIITNSFCLNNKKKKNVRLNNL